MGSKALPAPKRKKPSSFTEFTFLPLPVLQKVKVTKNKREKGAKRIQNKISNVGSRRYWRQQKQFESKAVIMKSCGQTEPTFWSEREKGNNSKNNEKPVKISCPLFESKAI